MYNRHRRWSLDGTWSAVLDRLRVGADLDEGADWTVGVDSTVARAHQHAAGASRSPAADDPAAQPETVQGRGVDVVDVAGAEVLTGG